MLKGLFVKRNKIGRERANGSTQLSRISRQPISQDQLRAKSKTSPRDVELFVKHYHRDERASLAERKRLFLRVGDEVTHLHYESWGLGVVMEVMTSSVPGGTCLARIRFQDGQLRCFNNDLDNETCCYYFGVRRYWNPSHGFDAARSKFFLRG
jgi:hypothetical protein